MKLLNVSANDWNQSYVLFRSPFAVLTKFRICSQSTELYFSFNQTTSFWVSRLIDFICFSPVGFEFYDSQRGQELRGLNTASSFLSMMVRSTVSRSVCVIMWGPRTTTGEKSSYYSMVPFHKDERSIEGNCHRHHKTNSSGKHAYLRHHH